MITNTSLVLGGLIIAIIGLIVWIIKLELRLKKVFVGKKANDLEEVIGLLSKKTQNVSEHQEFSDKRITTLEQKITRSIQGLEMIRFNPFKDAGSNQSFAVAFLNEQGDGIILSSLYARERMSVFAKPIKAHSSEFELTTEEKQAIEKARIKQS